MHGHNLNSWDLHTLFNCFLSLKKMKSRRKPATSKTTLRIHLQSAADKNQRTVVLPLPCRQFIKTTYTTNLNMRGVT